LDSATWHPAVPVSGMNLPGIVYSGCKQYAFDIMRHLLSAQMKLTVEPTIENPKEIIFKAISMHAYPGSGNRVTEGKSYQQERFYRVKFPLSLTIAAEMNSSTMSQQTDWVNIKPNPFNPSTRILFNITSKSQVSDVKINITAVDGRTVRTFSENFFNRSGKLFYVDWNGTDRIGRRVAAGVYMVNVMTPGMVLSTRAVFLP
jgi:hypothetical protein